MYYPNKIKICFILMFSIVAMAFADNTTPLPNDENDKHYKTSLMFFSGFLYEYNFNDYLGLGASFFITGIGYGFTSKTMTLSYGPSIVLNYYPNKLLGKRSLVLLTKNHLRFSKTFPGDNIINNIQSIEIGFEKRNKKSYKISIGPGINISSLIKSNVNFIDCLELSGSICFGFGI